MRRCNKCSQRALVFSFEFRRGRGLGKGFFIFSLCSQYVSTMFPSSFQYVPKFNVFPNMFPIAPNYNHTLVWLILLPQVWILFCDALGSCERKLYLNCMINMLSLSVILLFNWFCLLIYFLVWPIVDQSVNQ